MAMYAPQAYRFLLFSTTLFNLGAAEYLARVKAVTTEPAHLLLRQASTDASCAAGATSCNDGQPGCCSIGQACTFDASHRPICAGSCSGLLLCSGDMAGLCCDAGLTCNTQSTLCVVNSSTRTSMVLTVPTQVENSTVVMTMIVTASSHSAPATTTAMSIASSQPSTSYTAPTDVSTSLMIPSTGANTVLPITSENYTLPTSSFSGPGLYFTYTTVFVTDPSSTSETSSSSSEGVYQVTKTVTALVKSGQHRAGSSFRKIMFGCVLALMFLNI